MRRFKGTNLQAGTVERINHTKRLLQFQTSLSLIKVELIVTFEGERLDGMREVMAVAVFLQVGNKLVDVLRCCAEGATGREVDVADDLVHTNDTSDVASLVCLFMQLL